ncbi:DUF6896 domain-containing protein [Streptomyces sp. BK340]|uniref:DUF6896 domain-containing protein n=1 Tax=Streptomyces sp. BK340 TaxID=2572903 RepID=UPI0011A4814A|nr:hypothetical protein [Streptomyces sp. BK340]TVZ79057.1 hypothetical protein FB157_13355 [Streptomyces sp. BK340]
MGGAHATTARDLVVGYVQALSSADAAMRAAFPSLERLADVLGLVRSRKIGRSGELGTCSYKVHGAGCRFITREGSEIDVDFTADGAAIFDLWRLRRYGRSLPAPLDLTEHDLWSAVELLRPLLAEVRPGWFSVAEDKASA